MDNTLFQGKLVRLAAIDAEAMSKAQVRWRMDSGFYRLYDSDPLRPFTSRQIKEWAEKTLEKLGSELVWFGIRTRAEDRLIGELMIENLQSMHREGWISIGLGEREYWGRGFGTEAMRLALRYAFQELNLHKVALNVFDYNERAVRSYEKAGFRHEGRVKEAVLREGQRWDLLYMGILRQEWEGMQEE